MRVPAIMRTTAARLSALYLLLFSLCAVLLVVYMTGVAARFILNETRTTVTEEVVALGDIYARGGLRGLVRGIDRRARQPGANLYLVADPTGRILAGNVQSLDPEILEREGWIGEPFHYERFAETSGGDGARRPYFAVAQVIVLPNGMRVLVGRDLVEPERFRTVVRRALMMALGVMGIGALAIWYYVGRRALRRIDRVSVASQRIMGGDLSGRLPVTEAGDEFDRLSENLNVMLDRIAVLNEGLRQVSDSIAHDLKTPLTRLRNRAERALVGGEGGEREALEGIIGEADQLIAVFNALLMISRVEAGYSGQEMNAVDLASAVSDVAELYEPVAEEAGVRLTVDASGPAEIRGNRELIGQALTNLVDNAIKYAGGTRDDAAITIALAATGDGWDVTVADNGPGIPEVERERVLERFVRLDESRSKPGSGLGLSLVRAVMLLHGGSVALEDAGPGLQVRLHFPAARSAIVRS